MLPLNEGVLYILNWINKFSGPLVVAVAGGTASGKSYVTRAVTSIVPDSNVFSMDHYYLGRSKRNGDNFDEPSALDLPLFYDHLGMLKRGQGIRKPIYDFVISERVGVEEGFLPKRVIFVDGLFALSELLLPLIDLKVFVYALEPVRFIRRMDRDIRERGRTVEEVTARWSNTIKPMYDLHIEFQMDLADLVIDNNSYLPN